MRLLRLATTLLITVVVVVSAVRVPALRALASAPTSARIAVQFVDEQTPEQLATFETTYGVMAVLPITDASLISFTAVDTDAVLTAVAGDPAVAAASRVTPLRRQSALSAGSNASLKLSTEGPDTFSAALVPRKTVAVGQVFPVSAIIETDGAATNSTTLDVFYDPAKFQLVNSSGVALANASAIPNTAPYKGGSGVLFNNWEVNSSSINTTTGRATLTLSTNLTPSDTEEDVFSSTDTAAPAGYHAGLDRLVTLYFKALVAVATPANDNIAILPNADTGSQAAQDEKIIRFADWASVPTSTCAAGGKPCVYVHAGAGNTVAVGDTRIVPSTASTCNSGTSVCAADSVVVAGDNDVGNTLAPGILANVGFTGAGASRVSGDPVYLNNDYPTGSTASVFGTITAGDTRLLPASGNVCSAGTAVCMIGSSVAAGDTDISSTLKHLNNVRQTDSGGSFTDLIANNAMQTAGVKITATAGTVSTSASSVSAAPSCVSSNGVAASTITVTARDSGNLPISGATVTLAKSPSSSSAVIGASTPATTNASGQVTFSVTDTVAETVTFTATINGTPVTQTAA
ncbi:MAG: Invasin, domain 3, partial [Thermoanaerobaculia bacterium]|nr:Invasin, domain 3 [Thermoanaerobaculia bacterium]